MNRDSSCRPLRNNRTLIYYVCSTTLISFMVYFVVLSYNKSLTRLGNLESDIQEILVELSKMSSGPPGSKENPRVRSKTGICPHNMIEEYVKKYTDNLNKELTSTKKLVESFVDSYICGSKQKKLQIIPVNYALESLGAKIESVKDEPIHCGNFILSFLGFQFSNSPKQVLSPITYPGSCYAFRGYESSIVINLMRMVYVDSVSIEHILENMAPSGDISNAPKDFSVFGVVIHNYETKEYLLGTFTYNIFLREKVQYFQTTQKDKTKSFKFIKFDFLTNNGHENHTCVYRIGVHGKLS